MDKQNRFLSPVSLAAVAALIVFCVKTFCKVDISETVNGLVDVLTPVLVAFGIFNNPTDREKF